MEPLIIIIKLFDLMHWKKTMFSREY